MMPPGRPGGRTRARSLLEWKAMKQAVITLFALLGTDHYADTNGVPQHADHACEVSTTYDNPTDHDIDAMAALWIYVAD